LLKKSVHRLCAGLTAYKLEIVIIFALFAISLFLAIEYLGMWGHDIHVPIVYHGDSFPILRFIRTFSFTGTFVYESRLGAPFGAWFVDYWYFSNEFHYAILVLFYRLLGTPGAAMNIYFLLQFPLTAIVAFFVMKNLKISTYAAFCGSLAYAFLFYRFVRHVSHLLLAAYSLVPLGVLLIFWLINDEKFLRFDKTFFKYRRNVLAILFLALIALSGVSYSFFLCFFVCAALIILLFKNVKEWKQSIGRCLIFLLLIILPTLVSAIPSLIALFRIGPNTYNALAQTRLLSDVEFYALRIWRLFIPANTRSIPQLEEIRSAFFANRLYGAEETEYVGALGVLGLIVLFSIIGMGKLSCSIKEKELSSHIKNLANLSILNVFGILLATMGGFSFIFAILISGSIRSYNRMSVFIAFFAILSICIVVTILMGIFRERKVIKCLIIFSFTAIAVYSLIEPQDYFSRDLEHTRTAFYSDRHFVQEIKNKVSPNAMIYQMPYYDFFEFASAPHQTQMPYRHTIGFVHSKDLRWSSGEVQGRHASNWHRSLRVLNTEGIVCVIALVGFEGIYLDRHLFEARHKAYDLQFELENILGIHPLISNDTSLVFFSLTEYRDLMQSHFVEEELNYIQESLLEDPNNIFRIMHRIYWSESRLPGMPMSLANFSSQVGSSIGNSIISSGDFGYLLFGPFIELDAGQWEIEFDITIVDYTQEPLGLIDVVSSSGLVQIAEYFISPESFSSSVQTFTLPFSLDEHAYDVEFRVLALEGTILSVDAVTLRPRTDGSMYE